MAKYTIELRRICDLYSRNEVECWFKDYNLEDYLTSEEIESINKTGIWSKDKLAKKIVDHYYMREIGLETPALFRHYAKVTMQEIMEEKLPLIYSSSIKYDPLVNVDYKEEFTRNIKNNGESKSNGSGLSINSDTPQGHINKTDILTGKYASSTGSSESEVSGETKENTDENYTRHFKGNQGITATYQAMVKQYRNNIIAIDRDIISELDILFMGIY